MKVHDAVAGTVHVSESVDDVLEGVIRELGRAIRRALLLDDNLPGGSVRITVTPAECHLEFLVGGVVLAGHKVSL